MYIDCHVHLDPFTDTEVGEILDRASGVGVRAVISAGTTIPSSERSLELSAKYDGFFSGVGIHPMDIREPFTDRTYETLRDLALSTDKVLVMSESRPGLHGRGARPCHPVSCLQGTDSTRPRAWSCL